MRATLNFCSKSGQSGQMTMPARRASKFSAKRRAVLLLIIFQSLISDEIPWIIEPWPECQPELCYIWRWWSLEITRPCRTVLFWHRFVFILKHFVCWGAACVVCFMFLNLNVFKNLNVCFAQPSFWYSVSTDLRSPLVPAAPPTDLSICWISKLLKNDKSTRCMLHKSRGVFFLRSPKRRRQHRPDAPWWGSLNGI